MSAKATSVAEKVTAALKTSQAEMPAYSVASVASLRALSSEALAAFAKTKTNNTLSAAVELGKIVFILAETKPEKVVLKKHVRKELGIELEPAPYKVASAMRLVGEGHGTITEAEFDACAARWLYTVSSILNFIEKSDNCVTPEEQARVREDMAKVIRARSTKTGELLKLILDALKPEKDTAGEGEGDDAEAKVVPMDAKTCILFLREYIAGAESTEPLAVLNGALNDLMERAVARAAELGAQTSQPVAVAA